MLPPQLGLGWASRDLSELPTLEEGLLSSAEASGAAAPASPLDVQESRFSPCLPLLLSPAAESFLQGSQLDFLPLRAIPDVSGASLDRSEPCQVYLRNLGIEQSPGSILAPFVPQAPLQELEFSPWQLRRLQHPLGTLAQGALLPAFELSQASCDSALSPLSVSLALGSEAAWGLLSPQDLSPQGLSPQDQCPQDQCPQDLSPQDQCPQGLSPQGLSPQDLCAQGLSPQDLSPQALSPQDQCPQGLSPQGLSPQGLSPQDQCPQGLSPQDLSPQDLCAQDQCPSSPQDLSPSSPRLSGEPPGSPGAQLEEVAAPGCPARGAEGSPGCAGAEQELGCPQAGGTGAQEPSSWGALQGWAVGALSAAGTQMESEPGPQSCRVGSESSQGQDRDSLGPGAEQDRDSLLGPGILQDRDSLLAQAEGLTASWSHPALPPASCRDPGSPPPALLRREGDPRGPRLGRDWIPALQRGLWWDGAVTLTTRGVQGGGLGAHPLASLGWGDAAAVGVQHREGPRGRAQEPRTGKSTGRSEPEGSSSVTTDWKQAAPVGLAQGRASSQLGPGPAPGLGLEPLGSVPSGLAAAQGSWSRPGRAPGTRGSEDSSSGDSLSASVRELLGEPQSSQQQGSAPGALQSILPKAGAARTRVGSTVRAARTRVGSRDGAARTWAGSSSSSGDSLSAHVRELLQKPQSSQQQGSVPLQSILPGAGAARTWTGSGSGSGSGAGSGSGSGSSSSSRQSLAARVRELLGAGPPGIDTSQMLRSAEEQERRIRAWVKLKLSQESGPGWGEERQPRMEGAEAELLPRARKPARATDPWLCGLEAAPEYLRKQEQQLEQQLEPFQAPRDRHRQLSRAREPFQPSSPPAAPASPGAEPWGCSLLQELQLEPWNTAELQDLKSLSAAELQDLKLGPRDIAELQDLQLDLKNSAELQLEPRNSAELQLEPRSSAELQLEPRSSAELQLEPRSSAELQLEPRSSAELQLEPRSSAELQLEPRSSAELQLEPRSSAELQLEPRSSAELQLEPRSSAELQLEPRSSAELQLEPRSSAELQLEPRSSAELQLEPRSSAELQLEPRSSAELQLEPRSSAELQLEPRSSAELQLDPKNSAELQLEPRSSAELQLEPRSSAELQLEPRSSAELQLEPRSSAELQLEPRSSAELQLEPRSSAELQLEPRSSAELQLEPRSSAELQLEPRSSAELQLEPRSSAELQLEPRSSAELQLEPRSSAELQLEPRSSAELQLEPRSSAELQLEPRSSAELQLEPRSECRAAWVCEFGVPWVWGCRAAWVWVWGCRVPRVWGCTWGTPVPWQSSVPPLQLLPCVPPMPRGSWASRAPPPPSAPPWCPQHTAPASGRLLGGGGWAQSPGPGCRAVPLARDRPLLPLPALEVLRSLGKDRA
uniref:ALMS motif domain-containing protein n=1 Tax=Ficedula albicollis TaxID=59894 RepID=A0A803VV84_FICAL